MRVLLSGGMKTQNIVDEIKRKLGSNGVDFLVVQYIEDIDDIFARGEYFDRAIIIEQCWNHDFEKIDEMGIRERVNNFAQSSAERQTKGVEYVFLAQTDESATVVYEEILRIRADSVVVIKAPQYHATFFNSLAICALAEFPDHIVYKPTLIDAPDEEAIFEGIELDSANVIYTSEEVDDISRELFNAEEISAPGLEAFDGGIEFEREDGLDKTDDNEDLWDSDFDSDTIEEDDITVEDEGEIQVNYEYTDFEKSGDLPDFSQGQLDEEPIEGEVSRPEIKIDYLNTSLLLNDELYEESMSHTEIKVEPMNTSLLLNDELYEKPISNTKSNRDTDEKDTSNAFNNNQYTENTEPTISILQTSAKINISNEQIKATLDAFASRGNSIAITGCGGGGTSTIAYNLANTIVNIGYTVLLVDMDTEQRAQSYISKDNHNCMEHDGANLMAALNSSSGINAHVSIVRPGFRLLTMGLGGDILSLEKMVEKHKLSRFINLAKTSHNFVIYDLPFKSAIGCASDVTFMADNLVTVVDSSNWGITKTMIAICNIETDDMQDTVFSKGQLLYNKYRGFNKVMGKKVKSAMDISKVMDSKVLELLGEDPGYYFQAMHICGIVNDDTKFEQGWFGTTQYSDTEAGKKIFTELLINIVLKR